jgi:hypothetical protein
LKELELTAGRATGIPAIFKSLEDNWSPLPKLNTNEDLSFFEVAPFIHERKLEVQLKSLNTVLKMANITTRAKPKNPIFFPTPIILIYGSILNLLPYYSFCIFA